MISRRAILKYGLGGACVLTVSGVGLSLRPTVEVSPVRPLRALSARQFSILAAVADTIVPGGAGVPTAREIEVAERIDDVLALSHPGVLSEFQQVLSLLENALAGLVLDGRITPFSGCTLDERAQILASWRSSNTLLFRTAFKALHGFCTASYYSHPKLREHVGYPGVPQWITEHRLRATP